MELRRKLEAHGPRLIHTLRGRGYLFGEAPGEASPGHDPHHPPFLVLHGLAGCVLVGFSLGLDVLALARISTARPTTASSGR